MPNLDEIHKSVKDISGNAIPEHVNFYLTGVFNSLMPDFLAPEKRMIEAEDVGGETIEALRTIATKLHPDLPEGQSALVKYSDINKLFKTGSYYDDFSADTVADQLKLALGNFTLTRKGGKYVVSDVYDFERSGDVDNIFAAVGRTIKHKTPYYAARYVAESLMAEGNEDNLKIRIEIPDEPQVVASDFDDDIPPQATNTVFRGPMTNKRKAIWDAFSSNAFVDDIA